MSEVLRGIEPLSYNPLRYIELVEHYEYLAEDATTEARRTLLDEIKLQLQSDVAHLRPTLSTTFEGLLRAEEVVAAWHMAHWQKQGFEHGGFGTPIPGPETKKIGSEALEYLHAKIKETAEANDWKVFFPKHDYPIGFMYGTPGDLTWRMEQSSYIFDGTHFAQIHPTLFKVERTAMGDTENIEWLDASHNRKYAEVRTVLPIEGEMIDDRSLRKKHFRLEDGHPEGIPTQKELTFLEQVLAAYH